MKTFVPRYTQEKQKTPNTLTDKTDTTRLEGGFVSFVSTPLEGFPKNTGTQQVRQQEQSLRLPWQLERLLQAASSGVLTIGVTGIPDTNRYVMAWACEYLAGDKQEALKRLWEVYDLWQQSTN
jgi:hypothetical protein